jgi:hypothetical protein
MSRPPVRKNRTSRTAARMRKATLRQVMQSHEMPSVITVAERCVGIRPVTPKRVTRIGGRRLRITDTHGTFPLIALTGRTMHYDWSVNGKPLDTSQCRLVRQSQRQSADPRAPDQTLIEAMYNETDNYQRCLSKNREFGL